MDIEVIPVGIDEKEILKNLLEKYDYEFSQYDGRDVNNLGLYGYKYLDYYWTEDKRWAFFIKADRKLAGLAMVNDFPEAQEGTDFSMAEFFIMHKYRRCGVGRHAAWKLFDTFKGRWQLRCHPGNIGAACFWDHVVSIYTKGNYRLARSCPNTGYADGTLGDIYFFRS